MSSTTELLGGTIWIIGKGLLYMIGLLLLIGMGYVMRDAMSFIWTHRLPRFSAADWTRAGVELSIAIGISIISPFYSCFGIFAVLLWEGVLRRFPPTDNLPSKATLLAGLTPPTDPLDPAEICVVCQDKHVDPVCLPCNHTYCRACLTLVLETRITCPLCRQQFYSNEVLLRCWTVIQFLIVLGITMSIYQDYQDLSSGGIEFSLLGFITGFFYAFHDFLGLLMLFLFPTEPITVTEIVKGFLFAFWYFVMAFCRLHEISHVELCGYWERDPETIVLILETMFNSLYM